MFYEIHPIRATSTLTSAFTNTNRLATFIIAFAAGHGLNISCTILFDYSYRFAS